MKFNGILSNAKTGMNEIKLRDLLTERSNISTDSKINSMFPPIEIGSITLVDQIVLLSLGQIIKPKKVIEIGTYLGYSSALFAMNFKNSEIITIDLPKDGALNNLCFDESQIYSKGEDNDNFLRKKQNLDGEIYLKELEKSQLEQITLIKEDSTKLDFKQAFDHAEFIFIDGGHDYKIVKKDTENARSIIKKGVIVWHDYSSNIHSDVTTFLNEQNEKVIFHVMGSLCAFELIGYE